MRPNGRRACAKRRCRMKWAARLREAALQDEEGGTLDGA